ncbi:hypothetical protein J3R83DRAFT_10694 [Lanmaoa asiatica]|nr:hypothetical protein J3R83DRAFT_10694 [Lanmaoa asiatica]
MSANLLQYAGKMHILADDLESFLHVLGWTALRYLPAIDSYSAVSRGIDMTVFDEHYQAEGESAQGGHSKSNALGAGNYPSRNFQPRQPTPLRGLLRTLSSPFKSLYASDPPDETLREKYEKLKQRHPHDELAYSDHVVHIYDQGMQHLESSSWFITTIGDTLAKGPWPTDDKAVPNLPIGSSFTTDGQDVRKTTQLQNTYSQWERSKGLRRSSKRAASPTPEPSGKRRHCTPAASGSGS